ncbi:MAG: hypothetical protein H8F28_02155 [Fibrella sp.]|nr:hypothetical protein [Armatimonadota bacterium]
MSRVQIINGQEFVEMNDDDALESACLSYLERVGTPIIPDGELPNLYDSGDTK